MLLVLSSWASAHEMTPTYPKLVPSHVEGIYVAKMTVFNRRQDVQYYELGVFDGKFSPIPFTAAYKVIKLNYLRKVNLDVYIREQDINKVVYICSQSKLRKDDSVRTAVASRICSKVK